MRRRQLLQLGSAERGERAAGRTSPAETGCRPRAALTVVVFAGAGGADQRDDLAGRDLEADVVRAHDLLAPSPERRPAADSTRIPRRLRIGG